MDWFAHWMLKIDAMLLGVAMVLAVWFTVVAFMQGSVLSAYILSNAEAVQGTKFKINGFLYAALCWVWVIVEWNH